MSLRKLFGSKKNQEDTKSAVQQLEETKELLQKKADVFEQKIATELATAKRYGMKNKNMALKALARKKKYEQELNRIDNTLLVLESQQQTLDSAALNSEVFKVLKSTSDAMKTAHKNMGIDDVHKIMDSVAEQQEVANEISDAISNTDMFGNYVDEDELMAELEALQADEFENAVMNVGPPEAEATFPSVPSTELPGPSTAKPHASDKDLDDLLAWAE